MAARALHQMLSPSPGAVRDCLALLTVGDRVLLVGEGVELLRDEEACARLGPVAALADDLAAHALERLARERGASILDDAAWVSLVLDHVTVLSWS